LDALKSRKISTTEEKRIAIGLISSTEYTQRIRSVIDLSYFKNSYIEKIADWCLNFYDEHKKTPGKHIQDIFEAESNRLSEEESELIEKLLIDLSNKYDESNVNSSHLLSTTRKYFQERELEILVGNIAVLKEKGDLEEAEKQLEQYRKISFEIDRDVYINPGDTATRERIYRKKEEREDRFFTLPGDIGKFIGNMKRNDLIGVFARSKRGKSWLLNYMTNQAVMLNKKVVFFSIEMIDTETLIRLDKSFLPVVDARKGAGIYDCPVFDCLHNQTGDCRRRKSKVIVRNEQGIIDFKKYDKHKICNRCRNHKDLVRRNQYSPVVYNLKVHRKANDIYTMTKEMQRFNFLLDRNCRIVVRDKYSLTLPQIYQDLQQLAHVENFVPEIIVIDYIDILQVNSKHEGWQLENDKWKQVARLGGETHCLVITATQGNIGAVSAEVLNESHLGGWSGKIQHVNGLISINQTPTEKKEGIWRMGITGLRSEEFYEDETCMVLQDLKTGQFCLDSYFKWRY